MGFNPWMEKITWRREWLLWGGSKLAKMARSWHDGMALTPHFVNNDYVTAETIYSTCTCVSQRFM